MKLDIPFLQEWLTLSESKEKIKESRECMTDILWKWFTINKFLQANKWVGKWVTVHQIVADTDEGKKNITQVNLLDKNISNSWERFLFLVADAPVDENWLTKPVLNKKTNEYKSKKVNLWENKLMVKERTKANAEKIMNYFLDIFKTSVLNESIKLLDAWEKDFVKPVLSLFRDYTIFNGTVFGKIWTGKDYAEEYFKHFVEKRPVAVELDELKDFAFTDDGLLAKWDYTFTTRDGQKILWSFFMLIWEDNKWLHFKMFHSAARNSVNK